MRVERELDRLLPLADVVPERLHAAQRYSALAPGKRIRPALVYATADTLGVSLPARSHTAESAYDHGLVDELLVPGGAGEWVETSAPITPGNVQFSRQSPHGSQTTGIRMFGSME